MPRMPWPSRFATLTPVPACCLMAWARHAVVAGACVSDSISNHFLWDEGFAPVLSAQNPCSVSRQH
ncbi:exported hypothetical protein [Pseudomonas sp. IT-194MI4]